MRGLKITEWSAIAKGKLKDASDLGTLDIDPILISSVVIPSCHASSFIKKLGFTGFQAEIGNRPKGV